MTERIYRVTIDEHGVEDCHDYTDRRDAMIAFKAATRRRTVFSVAVDAYRARTETWDRVAYCENGIGDWA
jgi:hypothetical protein